MADEYLSNDPNAGLEEEPPPPPPPPPEEEYLSTDPNAGAPQPAAAPVPESPSAVAATAAAAAPDLGESAKNLGGAVEEFVKGVPQMVAALPGMAYQGAKFAAGGPQARTEVIGEALREGVPMGVQTAQDVQSPLGSKESFRGLINLGMMAAPAAGELGLTRILFGGKAPPVQARGATLTDLLFPKEKPPVQELTQATESAVKPPVQDRQLLVQPERRFQMVDEPAPEIAPARNIVESARYTPASRPGQETPVAEGAFPSISRSAEEARRTARTVETGVQSETARVGGEPSASEITSPESVTQPEVRTQVGEGTPLRQQGEVAEARQGVEAQPAQEVVPPAAETPALEVAPKTEGVPGTQAEIAVAREEKGIAPYERQMRQTWGDTVDKVKSKLEKEPEYGEDLARRIASKPRVATPEEHVALLENWRNKEVAYDRAMKSGDHDAFELAKRDAEEAYDALDKAGSKAGSALGIRRMILDEFYTPTRMRAEMKSAGMGKELSKGEEAMIDDLHKQFEAAKSGTEVESQRLADRGMSEKLSERMKRHNADLDKAAAEARESLIKERGSLKWEEQYNPCIL